MTWLIIKPTSGTAENFNPYLLGVHSSSRQPLVRVIHKSPDLLFRNHCSSFITAASRTVNQQLGHWWVAGSKERAQWTSSYRSAGRNFIDSTARQNICQSKKDVRLCDLRFRDYYSGCTDLNKIMKTRLPRRNGHASVRSSSVSVSNLTWRLRNGEACTSGSTTLPSSPSCVWSLWSPWSLVSICKGMYSLSIFLLQGFWVVAVWTVFDLQAFLFSGAQKAKRNI